MTQPVFFCISLKSDLNQLCAQLCPYFGFVFLQDQHLPVLAILPKNLWRPDQQLHYIRQADFSYKIVSSDKKALNFKHKIVSTPSDQAGFTGGYIAFFAYDYAARQHIQLDKMQQPEAIIAEYDIFIRQIAEEWRLYISEEYRHSLYVQQLIDSLQQAPTYMSSEVFKLHQPMQARWTKTQYQTAFERVQAYLYAGDCYQINLTQEFRSTIASGTLLSLLTELLDLSQAPFAAYLSFEHFELLSCSPELFIEFQPNRMLKTRPIKGTLPRHDDPMLDQQLKQQLTQSEKDKAENLMIVDLLRNDLSVYAETGSVKVPHLFEIESFAHVHHMVSEIQATLKSDVDLFEVLMTALPGGSITGAPKIRAMQIIAELEGNTRGAYCGSLGYFNYDGTGRFNILIRTLQRYGDDLSVWAGGGITVASNVEAEYQECLDKVNALLDFLNRYA